MTREFRAALDVPLLRAVHGRLMHIESPLLRVFCMPPVSQSSPSSLVENGAFDPPLLSRPTLEPGQKAWPRRPSQRRRRGPGPVGPFVPVLATNRDKRVRAFLAA